MADLEKSVAIIFEGVDQMGAGVDSATKKLDSIAGSVESATQPMADLTLGVLKFEGALLAAGSAVTAFSIKLAGDFDSQFREIATLIDAPSESLEGFRSQLRDYGSDSTQTLEQVNSAVYSAISAGVEYTDSLDAVRQAEQLAVAGRADLDQSLTVLVSSLNAYGEGMDEAERYSDLLFQTVRSGQTTLPELGASLAQVTSTAANAGVSFDELLAAVASITAGGAPTSQAVTQVRAAISSLIKPTADAASLAEELGLEFNASALESKGLEGVLREVEEATGGNVEQIGRLFSSQEALNGALALSGDGAERFSDNLLAMENSAGATEAAYEKMADSVENGTQRIQNAMQGALIGIGDPLLNEFGGIQAAIAEIFNAIGASVEGGQLSGFVDELEGLFQGIETTLREVARNLPDALEEADFSSFFDGIEAIREAVASLFDGADLTSADGLASVIETLGLGFEALAQYTAGAIEGIGPFLEQLASLTNWFLELDPALFAAAGAIGGVAVALNTAASAVTLFSGPLRALVGSGGLLAKATPLVSTLGAALGGPAGLAVLAGAAASAIVATGRDILGFNDSVDPATQVIIDQNKAIDEGRLVWDVAREEWVRAGDAQETLAGQVRRWNDELQDAFLGVSSGSDDLADHSRALEEVNAKYTDWDSVVDKAWKSSESFAAEQERTTQALLDQVSALAPLGDSFEQVGDGVFQQVSNVGAFNDALADAKAALDEGLITQDQFDRVAEAIDAQKTGAESAAEAQGKIADAALTSEEAILKARDAVLEQELALEELASNERIKSLELGVELQTAQLEADTQRIQAAFSSIDNTIASTGDTLGTLSDGLASFSSTSSSGYDEFYELVENEERRRDEAMETQKKLAEAQIEQLRARTEALRSGEGLINISSDGLEPALETIMWQIIEKVQLRANAEGAEFLLGLPS